MKFCTYIDRRCERWYPGYYREKELIGFDPTVLQLGPDTVLSGLFQSYHYFTEIEPLIRKELVLSSLPETTAYSLLKEEIVSSCSVAVHVRRGDYLHAPFLEVCTTDYYEKAIRHFQEQFERPKFFIFSDDLAWCHDHLHVPNAVFVDIPESRDLPVIDLELMKNCRHQIVANSTFSWWGAWLNSYEQKQVVTPQHWFKKTMTGMNQQAQKHLIPEAWVRI